MDIVVDVFDGYDNEESVKSAETERRQSAGPTGRQYSDSRKINTTLVKNMPLPENKAAQPVPLSVYHRKRVRESWL